MDQKIIDDGSTWRPRIDGGSQNTTGRVRISSRIPPGNGNGGRGAGDMTEFGERMARIEAGFAAMRGDITAIKSEAKSSFRWIIGTILAVAVAILTVISAQIKTQGEHFQGLINAHQKTSEARMDEFRRDSDRNYGMALKALERSMAADAKGKPTE